MKKYGNLLLFIFAAFLLPCSLSSQDKVLDSLKNILQNQKEDTNRVNTLYNISRHFLLQGNFDESLTYAIEELSLAIKLDFKKGMGDAFWLNAAAYYNQNNYQDAITNALKALEIKKELNDKRGAASAYQMLSSAHGIQGNYAENLKYSYESLRIREELNDKHGIAHQLTDLANTYINYGNYIEGRKNALAGFKLSQEVLDTNDLIWSRGILSRIDFKEGKLKEALDKRLLNIKLIEKMDSADADDYLADEYQYTGKIYEKHGEQAFDSGNEKDAKGYFMEAEKNYLLSLKVNERYNYKGYIASVHVDLANIAIKFNKLPAAEKHLQQGLELSKITGFKEVIRDSYKGLSMLDSIQGNFKEAFDHYKLYILYRDSILSIEGIGKSSEIKMQYGLEKKEAEDKIIQTKKDAETRLVRNLQYGAIIIFFIVGIFLYWNNYQKQKAKRQIEKAYAELKATQAQLIQNEKMASLGELTAGIAHEIQNPLNFVNNFSEVNRELIEEMKTEIDKGNLEDVKSIADDIQSNEQKINHHGKRADAIVKGMLQHSRSNNVIKEPADISKLADEYLRLAYHGLRAKDKSFNVTLKTEFGKDLQPVSIIPQEIGRVILNLINNAFYAVDEKKKQGPEGYEPTVWVSTRKINGNVEICVKDNGNGIPKSIVDKIFQPFFTTKPTGQGTGLGLSMSYDIIKAHGGQLTVETKEKEETAFTIILPN